jgi:hypothetical protein
VQTQGRKPSPLKEEALERQAQKKQDKINLKMRACQTLFESFSEKEIEEEQESSDGNETKGSNTSE